MKSSDIDLLNLEPSQRTFLDEVLDGLWRSDKQLPCKYFYDERGSQLFDKICRLDEYYLTRTESEITRRYAAEMADQIGADAMLVEFGSGSSTKTRILLDHLERPAAYVPVDISLAHLRKTAEQLNDEFPHIEVLPVCADFTDDFSLPHPARTPSHAAVYFPGSTIGNFEPAGVTEILSHIADLCGDGGGLLIGIDLHKQVDVLEAAYNDAAGVTAEFNLNLLARINAELAADFDLEQFEHRAIYNVDEGRVEISLVSKTDQYVEIDDDFFEFAAGESIHTEYSYKHTIDGFSELAADAGLALHKYWTDDRRYFAVAHFVVE